MFKLSKLSVINYFRPSLFVNNVSEISINGLWNRGFRMIICDLDNTLAPHFTKTPTAMAINFVNEAKEQGFVFVVVSNNTKKRVSEFCKKLNVDDFVYNAKKPFLRKTKKIIEKYKFDINDIIFIGDQNITDVWKSNRFQAKSILTLPIVDSVNTRNGFILKFLENYIYRYMQHKNLLNNDVDVEDKDVYEIL